MPGPKTHEIFYKHLKQLLSQEMLRTLHDYDKYSLFSQGHDLLLYCGWWRVWRLNKSIQDSLLLQEKNFREFIYRFMREAQRADILNTAQARLFIGPGYIAHHILDSHMHPLIIYYSGDHIRDPSKPTWKHGMIENLIDAYMMKHYELRDPRSCRVYEDFTLPENGFDSRLEQVIEKALSGVYGISGGGYRLKSALRDTRSFIRAAKYDPTGFKRVAFDLLDPFLKGSSSLSYNVDASEAEEYLNLEHDMWVNPKDQSIISSKSMIELYNDALSESCGIITELDRLCLSGVFTRADVYRIVPDRSSTYGLPCER